MKYLTVKEVQDVLKISHSTAYKLMKKKGFPAVKVGGKYIVEESALKKYLDEYIGKEVFTP